MFPGEYQMLPKAISSIFVIASLGMAVFTSAEPVKPAGVETEAVQTTAQTEQTAKPIASPTAAASSSASSAEPAEVLKTKTRSNQSND